MGDKNKYDELELKKFDMKSIVSDATILMLGRRRSGKSVSYNTEILMNDGSIKKVQDIVVGDLVMGDDSTPRTVLETHSGKDTMYEITNQKGESYTVNSHHILSLKYTGKKNLRERPERFSYQVLWFNKHKVKLDYRTFSYKDKDKEIVLQEAKHFLEQLKDDRIVDINVLDYLNLSKKYRDNLHGYQVPVNFPFKETEIDPYLLGYWLGDGTAKEPRITTQDLTTIKYLKENLSQYKCYLEYFNHESNRYHYNIKGYTKDNHFWNIIKKYNLVDNKHIPLQFKCNSRENRLKLLAGFIDSYGHYSEKGCYEICQSLEHSDLLDDIIYLSRSLGFASYKRQKKSSWTHNGIKKKGLAWRIHISGVGIEEIPTLCPRKKAHSRRLKQDVLISAITVKELPKNNYYGIELDGNHRYILGNFIVTHNSWLVRDLFYNNRHIPSGIVFSGTEEANPFFRDFIPDCFIHNEYDPNLINKIMNKQKGKIHEAKNKGIKDGKCIENNFFIVLDDMLHDAGSWKNDKTIKDIFFNGRHYNFMFILTMQYTNGIPPGLRSNIDYVFIFNEPSLVNRKKIYQDYAAIIPTFDYFCNILDACTQNHECLVIKTSNNSIDLRDNVFFYKAKEHSKFKAGHWKFWQYHKKNYNERYETENLSNDMRISTLKDKYASTKKLKVIVSRKDDRVIDLITSRSD